MELPIHWVTPCTKRIHTRHLIRSQLRYAIHQVIQLEPYMFLDVAIIHYSDEMSLSLATTPAIYVAKLTPGNQL